MQNSGESEFSGSDEKAPSLSITFWQVFLLTLTGASGLISIVADGPSWLTYSGLFSVILVLLWIIGTGRER